MKTKYLLFVFMLALQVAFAQTTYYVDVDASDGGNGTTTGTAWNEISDVNAATFIAGDEILFNSGDTFYGKLIVSFSGTIGNPIVFGKYGGNAKPIINGKNYIACIDASKQSYLTFNDLELINNSDEDTGIIDACTNGGCTNGAEQKRYGFFANSGGAIRNGIELNNLEIHNIYPSTADAAGEYNGHAIQFTAWGASDPNYFDGITINNCELYDTGILGISINKWGSPVNTNIHKNVTITNNYIHHTGGSGIVFFEVNTYLIENNIITYTGDYSMDVGHTPSRQRGRGSGFWNVRTSNGLLQYNEFSHAQGPKDSCGAHIDIENDNIIIQYNLSYDNAGGFAEYMGANTNCIYRYNISVNDGWRVKWDGTSSQEDHPEMYTAKGETNGQVGSAVWFSNYYGCSDCEVGSTNNAVYNNTFYIGKHVDDGWEIDINAYIEFESLTDENEIKNNIFYVETNSSITYDKEDNAGLLNVMDHNMYNRSEPTDPYFMGASDINGWPLLANAGGLNPEDYKLAPGSPAIDMGELIGSNGGVDYYNNPLSQNPLTDLGAYESLTCGDTNEFDSGWNSGTPTSSDLVTLISDYDTDIDGSFDACQLIVNSGQTLTISEGGYIKIYGSVTVRGTLIIEDGGSLVQEDDASIFKRTNSGNITVEKITDALSDTDFIISGSPMSEETREDVYASAYLVRSHDTDLFNPNVEVENDFPSAENFADDNGDNWVAHTGSLNPGEGYLVKPFAIGETGGTFTTNYTEGSLNNGIINFATKFGDNQNDSPNILSNPYASAINAFEFVTDNALVDAIYYWEHINAPNSSYPGYRASNYDMGDISLYSLGGGLAAANNGGGTQSSNQYIPSGQGFAIKANAAGTVTFNNAMRITGNNTGYRNNETTIDRLYISIANITYNLKSGTLIAFTALATDSYDSKYDAKRLATPVSLFSINEGNEYGIQGRSQFNTAHIIPLGFSTQVEETQEYTISINSVEGELISDTIVYLKDNLLNTLTNLSETDYTFTSVEGTQNNRFVIVFDQTILGNQDLENSLSLYPNPVSDNLIIQSTAGKIEAVIIYDLQGREVQQWSGEMVSNVQLELSNLYTSIYLIKIITEQGSATKRFIKL